MASGQPETAELIERVVALLILSMKFGLAQNRNDDFVRGTGVGRCHVKCRMPVDFRNDPGQPRCRLWIVAHIANELLSARDAQQRARFRPSPFLVVVRQAVSGYPLRYRPTAKRPAGLCQSKRIGGHRACPPRPDKDCVVAIMLAQEVGVIRREIWGVLRIRLGAWRNHLLHLQVAEDTVMGRPCYLVSIEAEK